MIGLFLTQPERRRALLASLGLVLFAAAGIGAWLSRTACVELAVRCNTPAVIQLYWDTGAGFYEDESATVDVAPSTAFRPVRFRLPRARLQGLRFDPGGAQGAVEVRSARIVTGDGRTLRVLPLERWRPLQQVEIVRQSPAGLWLRIPEGVDDPQVQIPVSPPLRPSSGISLLTLACSLAVGFCFWLLCAAAGTPIVRAAAAWLQRACPDSPQAVFLAFGVTMGLMYLFFTPAFQAPDEYYHFLRSYMVSDLQFFSTSQNGKIGGIFPRSVMAITNLHVEVPHHAEIRVDMDLEMAASERRLDRKDAAFMPVPVYSSVFAHVPQAAAIAAGSIFNLSPVILMRIGRHANLLLWLVCGYLAIRTTPVLKWFFVVLALMPMTLSQTASLSYDTLVFSTAYLYTAIVFRLAFDPARPSRPRAIFTLAVLSSLLVTSKIAYYPIVLSTLLIPARKFASPRRRVLALAILLLAPIAFTLADRAVTAAFTSFQTFVSVRDVPDGSSHMENLFNLGVFATVFARTLQAQGIFYLKAFIGILGWLDTELPAAAYGSYAFVLVLTLFADPTIPTVSARGRWLAAGIVTVIAGAVFVAMYLYSTPADAPYILGVQGRYFIPVAPLAGLVFAPRRANAWLSRHPSIRLAAIVIVIAACHLAAGVALLDRYYLPVR